jgi:hygromycin-B 7''-O-kinase
MQRPIFHSRADYSPRFTDAAYWEPYVAEVCRRHGLGPGERVRAGRPGSHPVCVVEERWVVKFFADQFSGEESFGIEREISSLLSRAPEFPAPRWVAEGALFPAGDGLTAGDSSTARGPAPGPASRVPPLLLPRPQTRRELWRWPYLVFPLVPGTSVGEVWGAVSQTDREEIARSLVRGLRVLHHLSLEGASVLRPGWEPFATWLGRQHAGLVERHRRWGSLPQRLIEELERFVPPVDVLLDRSRPPLLLHADMNADHLLGELKEGRWVSSGIIDFGDAKVGDLCYELVALHLGLFRGEKRLLRLFLESYGFAEEPRQPQFSARAMGFTLLHEFDVLGESFNRCPALHEAVSLVELARGLWALE